MGNPEKSWVAWSPRWCRSAGLDPRPLLGGLPSRPAASGLASGGGLGRPGTPGRGHTAESVALSSPSSGGVEPHFSRRRARRPRRRRPMATAGVMGGGLSRVDLTTGDQPVLGAPSGAVGGVDPHHQQGGIGRHLGEAVPEVGGGDARHQMAEASASPATGGPVPPALPALHPGGAGRDKSRSGGA